jgi:hypothetical protein
MAVSIRMDNVVPRTGVRSQPFTIRNAELVDGVQVTPEKLDTINDWFMVLSVTKEYGRFISFRPHVKEFKTGADARRYVGNTLKVPPATYQAREFVVVRMSKQAGFDFDCNIDTDNQGIIDEAKRLQASSGRVATTAGFTVPFTIDVFAIDSDTQRVIKSHVDAKLTLAPMRAMKSFDGYVALDFGNTSTTLVRTMANDDGFEVIQADVRLPADDRAGGAATPAQTALRIQGYQPASKPEHFSRYVSRIGAAAMQDLPGPWLAIGGGEVGSVSQDNQPSDFLLLGAKRLLSDRRRSEAGAGTVIMLDNEVFTIPSEDAAELFIANMIAGFFYHEQSIPEPIAVTCPTTFTESEVARLRRTVARALHRTQGEMASTFRQGMIESRVPLVIDEASAAAFYFVYKDFMSGPGRMPAFRYLYPNGMHMLLYDCGGGTTDLSLVRLEALDAGHMKLAVLGRAGHRTFGGDFITEQVFRLLKMKLALAGGGFKDPPPPAKLAEFLSENDKAFDTKVPTRYNTAQMQNEEAKARRDRTLALWQLAEAMKVALSDAAVVTLGQTESIPRSLVGKVGEAFGLGANLENWGVNFEVSRKELDALIDPQIDRTIEYANDLIRTCMAEQASAQYGADAVPLEIPEVHWVYLVGNASRYPRIKERMLDPQRGLAVRFLKERLAEVPPADFKNSVAKGAAVAMRFLRQAMGTSVSWDEDLIRKLPFDIVHATLGAAGDRVLFRAGDVYSSQMRETIDVRVNPGTTRATTQEIVLSRKWPGETRAEKYLVFKFPEPIQGRYVIEYDEEDEHAFIAYPDREGGRDERVIADPVDPAPYIAPPQSGKI